ncbi:cap-specific mRNA (nucleoside-2'-O-)-methyltransferase 2-like [Tetranychus urticae]|uniref:Cap-specific mRNA (nucleoside-2'-O-)-methyltransferase 2 n=1 Tax=Tetranychus urticae TaxID=32264 RepID=T1KPY2_TETUR|nr:cap-specific mRNA (nucleoside-2'-O-)-methyltransferase 2-like [Tetranychus urticae]XP_015789230.1 cap-specific mRNA (nucleoside-2'-O-)-methyltransferase 2-like [Tetranychus urticae]
MDYATNIDQLFDKRFTFNLKNLDTLENLDDFLTWPPWEFRCGSLFRHDLDCTRTLLDDKDLISWNKHTNRTDLTSFVLKEIRDKIQNELLTRAWCKLTEIITSFPVLDLESESKKDLNEVNALFLCEAPGSFVHAVNYYIQGKHPGLKFNWAASTLNPYYEQVDAIKTAIGDDRFIKHVKFYDHWFFGDDNRGDLLDVAFLQSIIDKFRNKPVDLVTGDGGINCIDAPEIQEELSFPLILHQFLAAINCLKAGGSFIVKMFNLFSSQTLSLTYLMTNLFSEVSFFKPVTSKSGNSEVYAVCIKLHESKRDLIDQLTKTYIQKGKESLQSSILPATIIPKQFIDQFTECSKLFKDFQKLAIERNLDIYNDPQREKIYLSLNKTKKAITRIYLKRYHTFTVSDRFRLTSGQDLDFKHLCMFKYYLYALLNAVCSQESYEKRKQDEQISFERITVILKNLYDRDEAENILNRWSTISPVDISKMKLTFGSGFNRITNSKFVDKYLLHLYNLVTDSSDCMPATEIASSAANKKTLDRFNSLITHVLSDDATQFKYILGPELSAISSLISNKFRHLESRMIVRGETSKYSSEGRNFVIIDPYSSHLTEISTAKCSKSLTIILQEQDVIKSILTQLIASIECLKSTDILILHMSSCLSRLMVGLIYLLTSLFADLAIIPSFTHTNPNRTTNFGMLLIFKGSSVENRRFDVATVQKVASSLEKIKNAYEMSQTKYQNSLLEIFSVPEILLNESFSKLIYTGNFVNLVEKMEYILT